MPEYWHDRLPLLFGERDGVRGSMPHRRLFRSLYVLCFSVGRLTRERVKGAIAPPLQSRLPAKKIAASRIVRPIPGAHPFGASASAVQNCSRQFCPQLIPAGLGSGVILHPCRSRPLGASLRLAPACGQRFGDFQPDQGVAVSRLLFCGYVIALRAKIYRLFVSNTSVPRWL